MVNYIWENIFRRRTETQQVRYFLQDNLLFQDLSPRELHVIEKLVHIRRFQASEAIFRQGEMGVGMYIIFKGQVGISLRQDDPNDQNTFITRLIEGDFFGELSLVESNSRRTATAISYQETVLIGFYKPDLKEVLDRYPVIGAKILLRLSEVLGRRLKETTDKITDLKEELKVLKMPAGEESGDVIPFAKA